MGGIRWLVQPRSSRSISAHSPPREVTRLAMPPEADPPRSLADYLDVLCRIAFEAGLSWRVVEAKWGDIGRAFHGFDPEPTARMTPRVVDKLLEHDRVIRSRRKIEATIDNAGDDACVCEGSQRVQALPRSNEYFESTVKDLRKRFTRRPRRLPLPLDRRRAGATLRRMGDVARASSPERFPARARRAPAA